MDRTDRKILALYQHDTRRIAESIAAAVGLPAAAVQRRLKRLRSEGVIAGEIAVLDKNFIGEAIVTCIVNLSMAAAPASGAHRLVSSCGVTVGILRWMAFLHRNA